jgi:hypothetical protein
VKAEPKPTWVMSSEAGQRVPPKVKWLIERLAKETSDHEQVVDGAFLIFAAWLAREHRADIKGHRLLGRVRRRAVSSEASDGPTDELKRLLATAKGGSEKEFARRWLATSGFVKKLVLQMDQPKTEERYDEHGRLVGFRRKSIDAAGMKLVKAGGFTIWIPQAKDAQPKIEDALAKLSSMPPGDIKRLRAKAVEITEAQFVEVICDVYTKLTGKVGISYSSIEHGLRDTSLITLWHDIDVEFGTKTFEKISRVRKATKRGAKKSY